MRSALPSSVFSAGVTAERTTTSSFGIPGNVTGSGTAGKAQVTAMVTRLLGLDAPPRPADAADALALAICHIWRGGTRDRIQAAAVAAASRSRRAAIARLPGGKR